MTNIAVERPDTQAQAVWEARSLAIVSLFAGRNECFGEWAHFLRTAELPPKTALYVVDNSGAREFSQMAQDQCQQIANDRSLLHLDYAIVGRPYAGAQNESYLTKARHQHVAQLYSSVLPRVTEDTVLTLEDDMQPTADTARRLADELGYGKEIGVVAATYAMPHNEREVCAGDSCDGGWGRTPRWEEIPHAPIDMGCVGGGCTLWANWALQNSPIQLRWERLLGWDAMLCLDVRRKGYKVRLHGGVRCGHHIHGRVKAA